MATFSSEPEKDLSTTVTLAILAYRKRSGINRNCFQYYCTNHNRDGIGATPARSPPGHSHLPHVKIFTTVKNMHRRLLLGNN